MNEQHVPAVENAFLSPVWRAVCSCGWQSEDSDGVAVAYRAEEYAIQAAQRHAADQQETT